jgi:hypothetical protein
VNNGYRLLKLDHRVAVKPTPIIAKKQYDHVFFDGDFDGADLNTIVCSVLCPSCNVNTMRVGVREFLGNKVQSLISEKLLSEEEVLDNGIADKYAFGDFLRYITKLGGTAEYVVAECGDCNAHLLIVVSVRETQPARYMVALNGVWIII